MNRLSQQTMRRFGFAGSREGRGRDTTVALHRSRSLLEVLEDRTLLSLDLNNVENLKALAISAVQNMSTTQDVATFNDTDSPPSPPTSPPRSTGAMAAFHRRHHHRRRLQRLPRHRHPHLRTSPARSRSLSRSRTYNGTLYATDAFNQTNLVSSVAGMAGVTDPSLINPWGTSSSSTSPIWVSDQGSGLSTLYNPNGNPIKQSLTVTIPAVGTPSGPTGQVFNTDTTTTDFTIPGPSGPVRSRLPLRHARRHDRRLEPGSNGGTASALTAATVTGAVVHRTGPGERRHHLLPLRRRLHGDHRRQRHRRLRPHLHQRLQHHLRRQVCRPQRRRGLPPLQHRLAQRRPLRRLRPAFGNRDHGRRLYRRVRHQRQLHQSDLHRHRGHQSQRPLGDGHRPSRASAPSAATSWSAASATRRPPPATGRSASSASPPRLARSWAR